MAKLLYKPKFHYADFASKSATSSQQSWTQIMIFRDTNHVADFHDLCRGLSWFVSATKSDFLHAL